MGITAFMKRHLPSYRTEKRLMEELKNINEKLNELSGKNEFLFWNSQMRPDETMQETKERVFARMPKATGRLREIQLAENHILRRVKAICDKNEMHLFLVGGTLLGAVRHKGFIPWDNDVDIGMMKHDYLKLRELLSADEELTAEYCYNYQAGLKMSKVKFRKTDVFWIDILVFDYIDVTPENMQEIWAKTQAANLEHGKKIRELAECHIGESHCRPVADSELDCAIGAFEEEQRSAFPYFGKGDYFCEPIDCPYWSRDPRGIMLVNEYFPLLKDEVEFEGEKYEVWKNYEHALSLAYGDIWQLPYAIHEPHTSEFDEGLPEAIAYLHNCGILE